MKNKYIVSLIIFIAVYILAIIYLFFKIKISYEMLIRFIFSIVGMISIVFLNFKEKSTFILFFTAVSMLYFVVDSFFPICYSIIKCENYFLQNTSFLSNTEGFIMFFSTGYILFVIFRKKHSSQG